jgi:peptide deformylase
MKPIVHIPDTVLITPAKKVEWFDKKLTRLIADMKDTLIHTSNPKGVGLAAPQIGQPWRVFVTRPTEKSPVRTFINPIILSQSDNILDRDEGSDSKLEGCLSIPKIWGKVKRNSTLTLSYQDESGNHHEETFSGFEAVIIQHECDHLNGILFTHRVVEQQGPLYQTTTNKKGKEILEEIQLI